MAISDANGYTAILTALDVADWSELLAGVSKAEEWMRAATPGDPRIVEVISRLVVLARHSKWEVRHAVANIAGQTADPAFESAVAKLGTDENTRVRQAAQNAALRRRDWRHSSTLGKQHEDRINATLDDIEARFGARGRDAVKRASDQIANTFARELYHEVIKLLSPLAMRVDRLRLKLGDESTTRENLTADAVHIERRLEQLRAVLDGMRAYAEQPTLTFAVETLKDVIEDAAALVRDLGTHKAQPAIAIQVPASAMAEVSRARLVQAFTNILLNAVESYDGMQEPQPILVRAEAEEGRVVILVEDSGCGMSAEALADASTLFASRNHMALGSVCRSPSRSSSLNTVGG